jgi:hypothetical protein
VGKIILDVTAYCDPFYCDSIVTLYLLPPSESSARQRATTLLAITHYVSMLHNPSNSRSSALATTALRNAGLMDRDEHMHNPSDKPGGRKGFPKPRSHRPRLIDTIKGQPGPTRNSMVNIRLLLISLSTAFVHLPVPPYTYKRCLVLA